MLTLLMAEGALRVAGYSRPVFYRYDPVLGADLRPGIEGEYKKEDVVFVSLNEDGIRGPLRTRTKPPLTVRIAVLGDSFTEGFQVPYDKLFTTVLEKRLAACVPDGISIEVLNFGVSGFGTGREILKYKTLAREYDPDIVLLMFYPGNDFRNNHPDLEQNPLLPYFTVRNGALTLDDSFALTDTFRRKLKYSNLRNDVVNKSRILQLVNEVIVAVRAGGLFARHDGEQNEGAPEPLDYIAPTDPTWVESVSVTDAMLRDLADDLRHEKRTFVVANVVSLPEISFDPALRRAWDSVQRSGGLDWVERHFKGLAESAGFRFVPMSEAMRRISEERKSDFFYFDYLGRRGGHWNHHGHEAAGNVLAQNLCPMIEHPAA